MIKHLPLLLFIGLAWGQDSSVYIPKIDLFGFALESVAIGMLIGLGSGISLGVSLALLSNKGKPC